jgi:DNA primase
MAGVQNIVAPQGTAFTADHARILKRHANEVVLCFDSDIAGEKAAVRVLDSLLASGLAIRVATVPAPHDPDSFIKAHGGEAFRGLINKADGFFDFYLKLLCRTHDTATDKGRLAVLREMAEAVHKTGSAVLLDTYAQKTAQRLGVSPESVRAEFKKAKTPAAPMRSDPEDAMSFEEAEAQEIEPPSEREFWLTRFVLLDESHTGWVAQHLDPAWLRHPVVRRIVTARLAADAHGTWHDLAGFLSEFSDEEAREMITEAVAVQNPGEDLVRNLVETVIKLRSDNLDRRIKDLTVSLNRPEISIEESTEIEQEKARLRALRNTPLPPPS